MKNCELCEKSATIYCELDHANLCWDCDLKVHSANFLVAKHSRILLCHVCQSPTAWSAAGDRIGRTVSVCEKCMNDEEAEAEAEDEDEDEEEEIDLEDIQVVPWKSTPPPPLTAESESSSGESLTSCGKFSLKRMREDYDDSETSTRREVDEPPVAAEEHGGDELVDSFSTRMKMPSKIRKSEDSLTSGVYREN